MMAGDVSLEELLCVYSDIDGETIAWAMNRAGCILGIDSAYNSREGS
jgi:hypothetical protein